MSGSTAGGLKYDIILVEDASLHDEEMAGSLQQQGCEVPGLKSAQGSYPATRARSVSNAIRNFWGEY